MTQDIFNVLKNFEKHSNDMFAVHHSKEKGDPTPFLLRSSESGEDAVFDITNALDKNGLPDHDRPEHVDRRFYQAAQKEAVATLQLGRPWVATAAKSLLDHFSPQPSVRFGSDLVNAARAVRRSKHETFFQLHRHLQTWAIFRVALGAMSLPARRGWRTSWSWQTPKVQTRLSVSRWHA
jgi:hypothetical protein